jgi:hypothetical protein
MVEEVRTIQTTEIPDWLRKYQDEILTRAQYFRSIKLRRVPLCNRRQRKERQRELVRIFQCCKLVQEPWAKASAVCKQGCKQFSKGLVLWPGRSK